MRSPNKYFIALVLALYLIIQLCPSRVGSQPADNLTVFNDLMSTIAQKIFERLPLDAKSSILIRSPISADLGGRWLVEHGLVKNLYQHGVSNIYLEKSDSTVCWILDYQILGLNVSYARSEQKNSIERAFGLKLAVRALDGRSGRLFWLDEFQEEFHDKVPIQDVAKLENQGFAFTHGQLPRARMVKSYIEPVVVMMSTAAVIYLFFRLRSK